MTVTEEPSIDIVDVDIDIDPRFEERRAAVAEGRSVTLRRRLLGLGLFLVAAAMLVGSLFSPLLDVDTVEVHGAQTLDRDELLASAGVALGDPMVTASPGAIAARLEADGDVARATVTRRWPSTLDVRVTPRVAVVEFRWPDGSTAVAGRDGVLVSAGAVGVDAVRVVAVAEGIDGGSDGLPDVLAEVAGAVAMMPSDISRVVDSMIVTADEQLLFNLEAGAQVLFGDATDAEKKFASLSTTLGGQVDLDGVCRIDVRLISPVTMLRGAACND